MRRVIEAEGPEVELPSNIESVSYQVRKPWKHIHPTVYAVAKEDGRVGSQEYEVKAELLRHEPEIPGDAQHVQVVRVVKQDYMAVCWLEEA